MISVGDRIKIDDRSLGIFRILVAILIIVDVILRSRNLTRFYSDSGLSPRSLISEVYPEHITSIHFISGDPNIIAILFIIQLFFAILLLIGYKTRIVLFISFILVVSVDIRNPIITSYADTMFRLVLLWAIFLPLGNRFSVDSVIENKEQKQDNIIRITASFFILVQIISTYLINGLHKLSYYDRWISGDATYSIIQYEPVTFLLASYVQYLPRTLIQIGGIIWLLLLISSILMLITKGRKRYLIAVGIIGVHIVLALTTRVGAFSFVGMTSLVLFFDEQFWNDLKSISPKYLNNYKNIKSSSINFASKFPRCSTKLDINERYYQIGKILVLTILVVMGISMILAGFQTSLSTYDKSYEGAEMPFVHETQQAMATVRLEQPTWSFFTSGAANNWFNIVAVETKDGTDRDILNNRSVITDKAPYDGQLQNQFNTYRDRFYYNSFRGNATPEVVDHYLKYHCNNSNITQGAIYNAIEFEDGYMISKKGDLNCERPNSDVKEFVNEDELIRSDI